MFWYPLSAQRGLQDGVISSTYLGVQLVGCFLLFARRLSLSHRISTYRDGTRTAFKEKLRKKPTADRESAMARRS
jgi:hypothetical protein